MIEYREVRRVAALGQALFAAGLALLWCATAPAEEILVDGIAAQVGSGIVLASEIEEMTRPVIEKMRAADGTKGEG